MPILKTFFFFFWLRFELLHFGERNRNISRKVISTTQPAWQVGRYWKICIPPDFVLRQTIFVGFKTRHTRICVCICEGQSIRLNFVYTDTVKGQKVGVNNISEAPLNCLILADPVNAFYSIGTDKIQASAFHATVISKQRWDRICSSSGSRCAVCTAQSEVKSSPGIFFAAFPCSGSGRRAISYAKTSLGSAAVPAVFYLGIERKWGGVSWRGDGLQERFWSKMGSWSLHKVH